MSTLRGLLAVGLIASVLASLTVPARADERLDEAKRHFQAGSTRFALGEYREALDEFKAAYRLDDDPAFLYNIAQSYRLLGQPREALHAYRSYLTRAPDAPNRDEVAAKIELLKQQLAASPLPTTQAPENERPVGKSTPLYRRWWLWTAAGAVVVAGLGVGLGVGLTRSSAANNNFPTITF